MQKLSHKRNQKGFTIIEVLIVLAIAGLIMLIVFLAVPALQRNSRNNARNSDASRIAAAVTECLANRNGQTSSCTSDADIEQGVTTQLDTVTFSSGTGSNTEAVVEFATECATDGASKVSGAGTRSFTVMYQLEPAIDRCISS